MKKLLLIICCVFYFLAGQAQSLSKSGKTYVTLVPRDTLTIASKLALKLNQSDTVKTVRLFGNQTVGGLKTFGDIQLTKSVKWLSPRGSVDWDFVTVDSAVFYSGVPYRNFAIRVKAPIGTGYKQFTFNPNGDFYASGTVYPSGGIYVATGDIYTGRNLTVTGGVSVGGSISASNTIYSTKNLVASDSVITNNVFFGPRIYTNRIQLDNASTAAIYLNSNTASYTGLSLQRFSAENWFVGMSSANLNLVMIPSNPNSTTGAYVGINTTTPSQRLDVTGNIRASGSVIANTTTLTSDRRLKSNMVELKNAMGVLSQLHPLEYDKKESFSENAPVGHEYGFIAQDVQKILPSLVTEGRDQDKILSLNYTALIPFLVKSLQEKDQEIKEIKKELAELKEMIRKK